MSIFEMVQSMSENEEFSSLRDKAVASRAVEEYGDYEFYRDFALVPDDPDCFQTKDEVDRYKQFLADTLDKHYEEKES